MMHLFQKLLQILFFTRSYCSCNKHLSRPNCLSNFVLFLKKIVFWYFLFQESKWNKCNCKSALSLVQNKIWIGFKTLFNNNHRLTFSGLQFKSYWKSPFLSHAQFAIAFSLSFSRTLFSEIYPFFSLIFLLQQGLHFPKQLRILSKKRSDPKVTL